MRHTPRTLAWLVPLLALVLAYGVTTTVEGQGQSLSPQIASAVSQLITGVTPFTDLGFFSGGYANWGSGRGSTGYGLRDNAGTIEVKNSGGSWVAVNASSTVSAPTTSKYLLQTPDAALTNAQSLSVLASALLVNTTSTGVLTAYAGTSCTNMFPRSLSALAVATCSAVSLTADVTGILPIANGGTGLASYAQGDLLYASGTTTLASLPKNVTATRYLSNTGTTNNPAWAQIDLSTGVTGTLPVANGGGPGSGTSGGIPGYTSTTTLVSSVLLPQNALILGGGAGATPTPLASLGTATTLLHGNASGAPTFSAVNLTTDITGTLPSIQGGTGQATTAVGDLLYGSATNTWSKLADVAVGSLLRSGGIGAAPVWSTTTFPNSATLGDLLVANGTNTYGNLSDIAVGSYLRAGGVGALPVWSTLTLPNAAAIGDILMATGANTVTVLPDVGVGSVLASGGVGTAATYTSTPTVTTVTSTYYNSLASTIIAAATTIAPSRTIFHVSGTTAIDTITAPAGCTPTCTLDVIPDGVFTTTLAGNIGLASTAVVGRTLRFTYDGTKFWPSY